MTSNSIENRRFGRNWRGVLLPFLMAVFGSGTVAGQTPGACTEMVQLQPMLAELRSLRIELLQEKIERANTRIAELQQQLRRAEADRTEAGEIERSQAGELAEYQDQLFQPGLTPQDRAEIEKLRVQMMTLGTTRVAERKTAAERREAEVRDQLGVQQQWRQGLIEMLRVLGGAAAQNP